MPRHLTLATVLTALVAVLVVPPAPADAYRTDRADTVVVVPADGSTAATTFVTSRGARYRLTVSGTYAYDRFGGLADCGYRDTNATVAGQVWTASAGLLVDGAVVDCGAYDGTHTYVLHVTGTGARLRLAVAPDPTGYADNAGGLAVAVETALDVEAACAERTQPAPGAEPLVTYTVAAAAHQSGTEAAGTSTWVRCVAYSGGAPFVVAEATAPGPAAAAADTRGTFYDAQPALVTCLEAAVLDASGAVLLHRTWPCS